MYESPPSPPPKRNWTNDETKKMIEILKTKECLWKISGPGYNSVVKRGQSLKEIGIALQIPYDSVKDKYTRLRTKLVRMHKNLLDNQLAVRERDYKKNPEYYDSLQFMLDEMKYYKPRTDLTATAVAVAAPVIATQTEQNNFEIIPEILTKSINITENNLNIDLPSINVNNKKPCICQLCSSTVDDETFFINLSDRVNQQENIEHIVSKYFTFIQVKIIFIVFEWI